MTPHPDPPAPPAPARRLLAPLLAAALLASGLAAWRFWPRPRPAGPESDDPRLTFDTPFLNVRPEVGYVGDAACARCHADHAETYRRHPMGRSFAPLPDAAGLDRYDEAARNPFERDGVSFRVERRDGRVFHRVSRAGPDGRALFDIEAEARYVIGSGSHGRSYLINRDGYLFQSPISWYSQKNIWDLSPGYTPDRLFERRVGPSCLFCHCNDADPVPDTANLYREPIVRSHAIGCERCHGPGELHAASRARGEAPDSPADPTIVNPGHLEPALREAVCQQCHLQGEARVLRRGRQPFDFRPGLPLHLFWSAFVRPPELTDNKAVSHVEQMADSRCFRGSGGKLGCTSCHDSHRLPAPEQRTAFYRGRCLTCHAEAGCKVPEEKRRQQSPSDDCTACHMPRSPSSDVAHTAVTDHRIVRTAAARPDAPRRWLAPGEMPLSHFHRDRPGADTTRDLGMALVEVAANQPESARPLAATALPLLPEGTAADDPAALEARAEALVMLERPSEGLKVLEAVLARSPRRESALTTAADVARQLNRPAVAVEYWRRALEVNPWPYRYHARLAGALAALGDWPAAAEACRAALERNPVSLPTRRFWVRCLISARQRERAQAEFDTLLALSPASEAEELRRWFAEETR